MTVEINKGILPGAVNYICYNLRERDKEELFALRRHDDPGLLADEIARLPSNFAWTVYKDGTPVAIFGIAALWPGQYTAFGFGTDEWSKCALSIARHVKKELLPLLDNPKYKQATAWGMTDHRDGQAWCKLVGAKEVATIANYGKNGQSFTCYSWTRDNTPGDKSDVS